MYITWSREHKMYTDSTQEDFDKKFQANAANPAPYLQRSISAPAMAEHVCGLYLKTFFCVNLRVFSLV